MVKVPSSVTEPLETMVVSMVKVPSSVAPVDVGKLVPVRIVLPTVDVGVGSPESEGPGWMVSMVRIPSSDDDC